MTARAAMEMVALEQRRADLLTQIATTEAQRAALPAGQPGLVKINSEISNLQNTLRAVDMSIYAIENGAQLTEIKIDPEA